MTQPSVALAAINDHLPPQTTDPLSPGRTDLNPSDEPGIDELPDTDVDAPDDEVATPEDEGVPDIDPDNAEMDDLPNPR